METNYITRTPAIYLTVTGTIVVEICESLNLIVHKAMAAPIRQPQSEVTYQSSSA